MHIQVNAERLKIAFDNKDYFLEESNASQKVIDIISNWHLFSEFPILPDTKALLNKTEYLILCKFEEFKNNQDKNIDNENINEEGVIRLD